MPNIIAYLALLGWPLVAAALFHKLPIHKALIWTVVAGHLLLPSAVDVKIPMFPALDRSIVVSLSAFFLCLIYRRKADPLPDGGHMFARALLVVLLALTVLGPVITAFSNPEPLFYGPRVIPGLGLKDAIGMVQYWAIAVMPFWLGLRYLNTLEGHIALLQALVISGLIYSFPALFEIRMSPQLHVWTYGFFQHDFLQHIRSGGFRPVVFLEHGLHMGIFLCVAFLSALVLFKEALRTGSTAFGWFFSAVWLLLILFMSKNLGAFALAIASATIILLAGRHLQIIFAATLACVVLLYPMLRGAGWIPLDWIQGVSEAVSADRAGSLNFRLQNEEALLERANEKPIAGWGSWGRNQIHNPSNGEVLSTTDGTWIIFIGAYGWIGYISRFGLLTLPIFLFAAHRRLIGPSVTSRGLILILCTTLVDLIPNSALVNYVWMMAGGIAGFVIRYSSAGIRQDAKLDGTASPEVATATTGDAQAIWLLKSKSGPSDRKARRKNTAT